ncbi:unnamed protein product [Diamesa tonsa]
MVSIRHRSVESDGFGFGHLCGGVLITRSHILTLGSCISRITNDDRRIVWRPDQLILALGSRYRYDAVNTTFVTPREIRIHPQYSFDGLLNNVALIILRDPLIEMARVNPISISNSNIPLGSSCDIMGWGTVFSGNGSRELMTGRVNVVDISLCNNVPNRICAGPDYIRGCPGDDGGPLVCNNVVYGLIDFKNGNHCELDSQGRYEYYIRIADYHTWIMQVISTLTPTPTTTTPKDDDGGAAQIATILGQFPRFDITNNGNDNPENDHIPYMASIRLEAIDKDNFGRGHICAGVFISRKAILTAATCFYQDGVLVKPTDIRIVAGTKFRYEESFSTFIGVLETIIIHPEFNRTSAFESNIAIGILPEDIPEHHTLSVKEPKDLATRTPALATVCAIYGWGLSIYLDESPHLLKGDVQIVSKNLCRTSDNVVTDSTICAGPYNTNGCETDDGGPIMCGNTLHGLIAYRPKGFCSKTVLNRMGTYIDIAPYNDWIKATGASSITIINGFLLLISGIIIKLIN